MLQIQNKNIPIILLFLAVEIVFISLPMGTHTDIQYLLSAMSQALAALFALVFTIVLVVSQMASVHSHRLVDSVFGRETKIYMAFFAMAVIVPFVALKTQYYRKVFVWVSGTLAIVCIVYLIPFMLSVKENLKIESLLINISKRSVSKVRSELRGNYEEYHLSEIEQDECWEEIRIIDNIALSAWNRKDYDTFQIAINKLLWILTEIRSWHTIQEIRGRIGEVGRIITNDSRAINIVLDSIRDSFSCICENERNYPIKELLEDYRDLSLNVAEDGSLISLYHSLANYGQIGKAILTRQNKILENQDDLAVFLIENFHEVFSTEDFYPHRHRINILASLGDIGVLSAKMGLESATKRFLKSIVHLSIFDPLLRPPLHVVDIIREESEKRGWKSVYKFCQEVKRGTHRIVGKEKDVMSLLDE